MSFRISIAVAFFLALGVSAAAAKDNLTKVSSADKAACMPDALKLCRDAVPNVQKVLLCFDKNRDKLSNGCRAVLASYGM
jgi:hypothetical protein